MSKFKYFIPSLVLTLVVGWLCLTPKLENLNLKIHDKHAHLIAFFALALSYSLTFVKGLNNSQLIHGLIAGFLVTVGYGGLIEILQENLVPGRFGDIYDWIADTIGALVGILVSWFLFKTKKIPLFGSNYG